MQYLNLLPKRDLVCLLSVCEYVRKVQCLEHLQSCILELKNIILFDGALCIYIDKGTMEQGRFPDSIYQSVNFSNKFFKKYMNHRHYEKSAVCNSVLTTWQPQHWKSAWERDRQGLGRSSMQLALDYGYLDGWTCANYHHMHDCMSAFVFAGRKVEKDKRTTAILKYLTPHLAEAIKGIFNHNLTKHRAVNSMKLTSRELEVLKWIEQGKSTWDVSMILNRSERVVKWHINNVMRKLSALNRTHAVAIALRHGIID